MSARAKPQPGAVAAQAKGWAVELAQEATCPHADAEPRERTTRRQWFHCPACGARFARMLGT